MKAIFAICAAAALAGCCTYDYYQGGVKYTQSGPDCVYQFQEDGDKFSRYERQYNESKKIVYRNTSCARLYSDDNPSAYAKTNDRRVYANTVPSCGSRSGSCNGQQFVVVPANY